MVCPAVNPNLWAASCYRIEVAKGGTGVHFRGLRVMLSTVDLAFLHCPRKARASSYLLNRLSSSVLTSDVGPSPLVTTKTMLMR